MKRRLDRGEFAFAGGLGLVALGLYLLTLAPTVLYYSPEHFDSPHLQVVAYILGIPSYTGYPTYVMLTHLFTYLPVGDPAYRVNLASAVYGALAVSVVYLLCRRLETNRLGATTGSLAFGVTQTFWSQAVIAEVYTLHLLLTGLFLLALLLWRELRRDRYLLLAAFLGGLAMTNHLTSIFLLPSGLAFVAMMDGPRLGRPGIWLKGAGLFLVGLAPYLYLPLRAAMRPPLVGTDPSTLAGFLRLVSGGEHKGRILTFGPSELPGRVELYLSHLLENLNPALLALAAVGLAVLFLRDRAALVLLGGVFLLNLAYALEYDIDDLEIYFIPTYLMLCLLLGRGTSTLLEWINGIRWRRARLTLLVPPLILASVLIGVPQTYREVDSSDEYTGRRMIEAVAGKTQPGSTVIYHGSSLHYMQLVEGRREDIRLTDAFYTEEWVQTARRGLRYGPVYILYPGATNTRLYREAGYRLIPVEEGMLYRIVKR